MARASTRVNNIMKVLLDVLARAHGEGTVGVSGDIDKEHGTI